MARPSPRFAFSKDTAVTISLGVVAACLVATAGGAWALAHRVIRWEAKLEDTYTIREAEAAWNEAERKNPMFSGPDVIAIRKRYAFDPCVEPADAQAAVVDAATGNPEPNPTPN